MLWSWSYGSWIYNYLCNQCLSPLTLRVRIPFRQGLLDKTLCDKVCQRLETGFLRFPPSMIHSFTVTFGAKYLTGMVTSVPPYETFSLIKDNIHQSKNCENHLQNSNIWGMWPLSHVGHVTYSFVNMLFILTGIFDDKLLPQILSVSTTANAASMPPHHLIIPSPTTIHNKKTYSTVCAKTFWQTSPNNILEEFVLFD